MKLFKKIFIGLLALVLCLSCLAACKDEDGGEADNATVYHTVKFTEADGGAVVTERQVKHGSKLTEPAVPDKAGYIFDGWYKGSIPWSFEDAVNTDLILHARWLDADTVFSHTPTGDGTTTVITGLKLTRSYMRLPSVIGGYTVTGVGDGLFKDVSSEPPIYEIILPETVTHIGAEAFKGQSDVVIKVEGALESVGEYAFYGCGGLEEIRFTEGLTTVSAYAFSGTSLKQIILPTTLTHIDENAFESCVTLVAAAMPSAGLRVDNSAFSDTNIKILYLYGTDAQVGELFETGISSQNKPLHEAKIYLYSEAEPTGETAYDGFWYLDENERTRIWK